MTRSASRHILSAVIFFGSLSATLNMAHAQSSMADGVPINADYMLRDLVKKTILLKGHVQAVFQGQHLSCDQALVDVAAEKITAEGHVILSNVKTHVEGDRLVFNYKQNTGFIYNGFVKSGQVVFEGDVVEKIGEDHYLANNAFYTACETCPPGWSFSGRKIDAQLGGYARIQRPIFRIAGVPVLILPSLIVPLKSARQSGLLVPTMDYSKQGGLAFSAVYFWAIDRSQDLTFTAKWYRLRGYKAMEDYRFVLSEESRGDLKGAWLEDRALKEEYHFNDNVDRWFVNYDHIFNLPDDFVHRTDVRLVSDLRYTRDFPEEILGHGDPALENKMSISKSTDNTYSSLEGDVYTNLLRAYPLADNADSVHRLPEIRYSVKEQSLGNSGFVFNMNLDYVDFARNSFGYDSLQPCVSTKDAPGVTGYTCISTLRQAGKINPGQDLPKGAIEHDGFFHRSFVDPVTGLPINDLQRTGQRLDVQPTLAYPFQIGHYFDVLPYVTYRETQYRFDVPIDQNDQPAFDQTAARRYVETDVLTRTEFSTVYGDLSDVNSNRWKHTIEPQVGYSQIPILRKPRHPFFGDFDGQQYSRQFEPVSDADLGNPHTGVQFDYNDRTYEKRVVNYGLSSRLTKKTFKLGDARYDSLALFTVGQSYDFNEAQRKLHSHPWSTIDSQLEVHLEHFDTYTTFAYNPYANKGNTNTLVRGMINGSNFLQVSYSQTFLLDEEDYHLQAGSETRDLGLGFGVTSRYLEGVGEIRFSDITHKVQSWNYGLKIKPPGNCWVIQVVQQQVLGGYPNIHAAVSFNFGGEVHGDQTAANASGNPSTSTPAAPVAPPNPNAAPATTTM